MIKPKILARIRLSKLILRGRSFKEDFFAIAPYKYMPCSTRKTVYKNSFFRLSWPSQNVEYNKEICGNASSLNANDAVNASNAPGSSDELKASRSLVRGCASHCL